MYQELTLRFTGFIASLFLTLIAYSIITGTGFFNIDDAKTAVMVIFTLALIQSLIQLIFFIDVWHEKGIRWNLIIFVSTVSIIFIVIFFSIWIMDHLNYNMH
jgi:cytochrome o ubiquinol oxidase operon protein cyoD